MVGEVMAPEVEVARHLRGQGRWLVDHRREMEQGECGWLEALGRFDAGGGWAADGQHSCPDWLRWRTKMARSTCYEKVRLAQQLLVRPAVAEAFRDGRISYSAVRLICRLEEPEPETEQALVRLAERGTVRQLGQATELFRQLADQGRPPPDPTEHRSVRIRPDIDGWVRVEITMPMLEAAELTAGVDAFVAVGRREEQVSARADDERGSGSVGEPADSVSSAPDDDGADGDGLGPDDSDGEPATARSARADGSRGRSVHRARAVRDGPRGRGPLLGG